MPTHKVVKTPINPDFLDFISLMDAHQDVNKATMDLSTGNVLGHELMKKANEMSIEQNPDHGSMALIIGAAICILSTLLINSINGTPNKDYDEQMKLAEQMLGELFDITMTGVERALKDETIKHDA